MGTHLVMLLLQLELSASKAYFPVRHHSILNLLAFVSMFLVQRTLPQLLLIQQLCSFLLQFFRTKFLLFQFFQLFLVERAQFIVLLGVSFFHLSQGFVHRDFSLPLEHTLQIFQLLALTLGKNLVIKVR